MSPVKYFLMNIKILQLIEGARSARGTTVIIDVFRAFSTACYAYANGARGVIPVGDLNKAYRLKKENPSYILMGERDEKKPPGFDFGNSPHHILNEDFTGKTIVHTTSSGTQGIVNATGAERLITGSFVNAGAVIKYIQNIQPRDVSLVCMGYATQYPVEEDTFCAEYISAGLQEKKVDTRPMTDTIKQTSGRRFFNPANREQAPPEDFDLCTRIDIFDFVLLAEKDDHGLTRLRKLDVS